MKRPWLLMYADALVAMAEFFPLRISEKMSVSSKHLLIERPHPGVVPGLVGQGAHLVHDVRFVCHQSQ